MSNVEKLKSIQREIEKLAKEALDVYTAATGVKEHFKAESTWFRQIQTALYSNSPYGLRIDTLEDCVKFMEETNQPLTISADRPPILG